MSNPIGLGRRAFTPSRAGRVEDLAVRRIQLIRTFVGFAAVIWLAVSYQLVSSADGLLDDRMNEVWNSVLVMAVTFPFVVGVFVALSRPLNRRLFLRRALKPVGGMLTLFGSVFMVVLLAIEDLREVRADLLPRNEYVQLLGLLFLLVWWLPFVLYGVVMSSVTVFRTADIHELVPPLLATALVWELALIDLFAGSYEGVPFGTRLLFTLGAPISVTAVTMWEIRRLRTRHGITLRGALLR
ncbi:hypothetical protein [Streptomyces sp. H27-C3]|uniref:hypothetical protein n=1 Tax=Streptomyces sp. H27-C3 TaxID=3046305 RepID=UPI0024BA3B25|nr:hypothetical protein [Streptomyces sp. H27-C3]MDJ0466430.1 hypothetical protein [Streptomyces sp. H27-C3]